MKGNGRFIFIALAVVFLIVLARRDQRDVAMAASFGTAFAIVGSVFLLLVLAVGVAWLLHRRREAKRLDDASR